MKRLYSLVAIAVLAPLVSTGSSAAAEPSAGRSASNVHAEAETDCTVRNAHKELGTSAARTENGTYQHDAWLASSGAQRANEAIQASIDKRFGQDSKKAKDLRLSKGLIGVAFDDFAKEVVLVVDPERVDAQALRHDLSDVARREHSRSADVPHLAVRVQAGCFSAAKLLAAREILDARGWHPDAGSATYTGGLNAYTSTFEYTFRPQDKAVAEALKATLGDLVTIAYDGDPGRDDRRDDGQPHWGGAGIGVDGDGDPNVCTSGFTVDTATAGKAMVTAGHCFSNGQSIESGNEAYGRAQGEYGYPTYDMILINAATQNYDDDIYHNPYRAEHDPLDVGGQQNAVAGNHLCVSGMVSLSTCGNEVYCASCEEACDASGCTPALVGMYQNGSACTSGDSGAPYYRRESNTRVAGIHIASPGARCVGERVSSISAHLDVRAATSP